MQQLKNNLLLGLLVLLAGANVQAQYYGVSPSVVGEWALGLQVGSNYLRGDVPQVLPGYQVGLYTQNAFSRTMDIKFMVEGGLSQGLGTSPTQGFYNNSALNGEQDSLHFYDSTQTVYHNYQLQQLGLSAVLKLNLNRLVSPNSGDRLDLYLLGGISMMVYQTRLNVYNENSGQTYDYAQINAGEPATVRTQLTALLDGTYETLAQQDRLNNTSFGSWVLRSGFVGGAGFRVRLGDHVGLGLEGRYHFILDDLLAGQQWTDDNEISLSNDHLITAGLTLDYIF